MVEKIEAYKTSDGSLHSSPTAAATHEAKTRLTKCLGNQGVANSVMQNARCVYEALGILAEAGMFNEAEKVN